jgi:hypothetical protein
MAYGTTINIITVTPDPEGMLNQSGEHEMGRTEIFAPKVKTAQGVKNSPWHLLCLTQIFHIQLFNGQNETQ